MKTKSQLLFGLALLAGTCSLGGCVTYAPQPSAPPTTTTTQSTTTQPMPMAAPMPNSTTTTTTQQTNP